ncbi:AMP-binding enzyme [Hirsutella rhossiliensis]|uniref:Very long-chain fatty acid transport protein n=1 Tax=Hirsutella rhossiliensis TaxID=111463 RepID=A0A9P8MZA1_9HYPO|nr:AMP-binding enzyme domain-containing protein [Hirsutella rhossiliensis]KAH0964783.1 AMP-binding enzyme domain-containing protein [Hirsutella rhossiliensis]
MPVPLALAAPAAAATLAYLNARTSFWYDRLLLAAAAKAAFRLFTRQRRGRLNLFYVLEERAAASPAQDLLRFEGRRLSYADVYDRVLRCGAWMRERLGVGPGDVVAMVMVNSDAFIVVWWALWSIGARPAFINHNLVGQPLAHCIAAADARVCIADPAMAPALEADDVRSALAAAKEPSSSRSGPGPGPGPGLGLDVVVLTPELEAEALAHAPERAPDADRHADDLSAMAMLIYTSGTTGLPKPAVVSWAKCIVGGTVPEVLMARGGPDDVMYTAMPLYHSAAAVLSFCATVQAGATQALGRRFSARSFWDDVRDSGATSIQYVGETLRYLLAAPPAGLDPATGEDLDRRHGVRVAFGNGLRPDIWNEFKQRFGVDTVVEFYAATEGPFATWNVSRNDLTAGAIGRNGWLYNALQRLQVALVDVDWQTDAPRRDPATGFCVRVRPGQPGEMLCRLPADDLERRFQGYYRDPAATRAKVLRGVFSPGDAWFRTGDVTRWDADGRVFFSDRIGDTFRWKSENVSTAEVSHALGLHPAIREANVYGVALPHHDGRAGCAAVCFDRNPPGADTLRSLAAHVRASLPKYARPLFLRLVPEVGAAAQTTGTNKQQKHLLREAGVRPEPSPCPGRHDSASSDMYWLNGDSYVPFGDDDWRALQAGRVKL